MFKWLQNIIAFQTFMTDRTYKFHYFDTSKDSNKDITCNK